MAKLSARNRAELARYSKTRPGNSPDSSFVDKKIYRALMSDGKILEKATARWKDRKVLHTWAWRVVATIRDWKTKTQAEKDQFLLLWSEEKEELGWKKE